MSDVSPQPGAGYSPGEPRPSFDLDPRVAPAAPVELRPSHAPANAPRHSFWSTVLVAGIVAAVVATLVSGVILMAAGLGRWEPYTLQEGSTSLGPGAELEVYYKAPFRSPPNLSILGDAGSIRILDQKSDRFKVSNQSSFNSTFKWRAEGMRGN